jgi:hypothetical protein
MSCRIWLTTPGPFLLRLGTADGTFVMTGWITL